MSSSPRRSGSNKKSSSSASPLLNSLLRTAVSALSSDSKSSDRHSSSSHRSPHPEPGHLPRSHTQPEFRRQGDYDPSAGIPSHTTPSSSKDHTFDLLKTAAYELGKLVHDVEGKIRPSDKDKYQPEGIRSDADRFEEIGDDSESTRHRSSRRRGRSADSGRHRERHRGGHADEYYGNSAPPPPPQQAGGQFGYGDYTQQFNPAAQTHSYPYPPPGPQQQQHHLNHHDNNNYTHPMPSPQPMYSDSERPKLKRSKTSASKFAGDMGGELMRNLPALLDKAAWLLSLLEKKNATTRGGSGSSAGHSALLMALSLVMELYRNLGGADKIRSYNEKRALKKERGMRAEERYERY